jgi:hypothetical protein
MQWFYDLNIRKKLFLSYSLLGIITLLVGWVGYSGLSQVMFNQDEMTSTGIVQIRLLAEANSALLMTRGDIRVATYTSDDARREKYLKSTVEYGDKFDSFIKQFSQTSLTPGAIVNSCVNKITRPSAA